MLRHLGPFFATTEVSKLSADDVGAYISAKRRSGLAVKTITNHLNFAHGAFAFGIRRGWVVRNPVAMADRPVSPRWIRTSASSTARSSRPCSVRQRTICSVRPIGRSGSPQP